MNPALTQGLARARRMLAGFTPGQRAIVAVAVLGLVLGAVALSRWAAQPTWAPLYGGLSGADANAVVEQLRTDGVPYQLADGGATVLVPEEQVYSARVALSGQGLPAGESESGWALLDQQGLTTTDFQQNVAYRRALEGELSKTLEAMDGVRSAVVRLALPKKDVFSTEADKPTASVLVSLRPGTELGRDEVRAVTHLVAGSVEGLDPANVTVADSTGALLTNTATGADGQADAAGETDERTAAYEDRLSREVQRVLDQVTGPGRNVVRVNAQLDFSSRDQTSERYTNPDPEALPQSEATVTEEYTGNGAAAGGQVGVTDPTLVDGATGNGTYAKEQRTVNNSVDKTVERVQAAPGAVQRLTVAVVLDAEVAGALDPAQVQQIVANAVGLDPARGDAVQVDVMPFDDAAAQAAQEAIAQAEAEERTQQFVDLGTRAGLGLLALVALFLLTRGGRKKKGPKVTATASDLPSEGVLLTGAAAELAAAEPLALTAQEIDRDREKIRKDVNALVENQPEDVAQMLQGWLEERT